MICSSMFNINNLRNINVTNLSITFFSLQICFFIKNQFPFVISTGAISSLTLARFAGKDEMSRLRFASLDMTREGSVISAGAISSLTLARFAGKDEMSRLRFASLDMTREGSVISTGAISSFFVISTGAISSLTLARFAGKDEMSRLRQT
ncbi:MAG: hypothetical protein K0B81_04280 [Candidatus Cloacimonetes bacterium]|nr:hypothetical protein [Candidatus Cloacimonadota bacterium]